jgi:hypothetical protein
MCHCTIACALITAKLTQQRKIGTDITGKQSRRRFVSGHSLCDVTCDSSPLQLLRAHGTVFVTANETVESFVSCSSFTWVNVTTCELVIIEMDRFAFQQAASFIIYIKSSVQFVSFVKDSMNGVLYHRKFCKSVITL